MYSFKFWHKIYKVLIKLCYCENLNMLQNFNIICLVSIIAIKQYIALDG